MNFRNLLAAGALTGLASLAPAQITDLSGWTLVQDPAHPSLNSTQSSSSIVLTAGPTSIPHATDIGYQSVNGNTAATSTSGYKFSLSQNFGVAVDYTFSASSVAGNLAFGFGIGEDINGSNSAGVTIVAVNGSLFASGSAGRVNDVNLPIVGLQVSPPTTGSLYVSYDAADGSVKVGTGIIGLGVPNLNFTYSNIASSWTGADLFPAFYLRSDASFGAPFTSGNAQVSFTNFRITNGVSSPVPEPATYAALFGVLALAFAAWRGRKG